MDLSTNFHKLTAIIEPTSTQYQWLLDNGFPLPSAQIIRLDDPIQHGDSGSPILNEQGLLVGIADGGLLKGVQRMNWGISAKAHISDLVNSQEDVKVNPSRLPFLKSARSENVAFDTGAADLDLYHIFTESMGGIYETAYYEDQKLMQIYRGYASNLSGYDIFGHQIEVFEDYATGATIAIPNGLRFEYDADNGLLRAWSPSGNVEMNILIKRASSFQDAVAHVDDFKNELFMFQKWFDRPEGNKVTDESNRKLFIESINCAQLDESRNEKASLIAEILIEGPYVLATSVTVNNLSAADNNKDDWYYTYAMEACLVLCGFPIY